VTRPASGLTKSKTGLKTELERCAVRRHSSKPPWNSSGSWKKYSAAFESHGALIDVEVKRSSRGPSGVVVERQLIES